MQRLFKVNVGETVKEQFEVDLALEYEGVKRLEDAIVVCAAERDGASRELFERILVSEQVHIDWIEAQLGQIEQMGLENYLAVQVRE
jgi:bacterioferritin